MQGRFFAEQTVKFSAVPAFRAEHFPYAGPYPWLDRPDALDRIDEKLNRGELTEAEAEQCRCWSQHGYIIIPKLFDDATLDTVWSAYEKAIASGRIRLQPEPAGEGDPYPGRFLQPHKKSAAFCRILKHAELLRWIRLLMEREPKPLQTIMSHKGSQQGVHSDSIHMTTYPLGYLSAAWIAFEDIHPDCGPLVYYPGSHKLPYVFSKDVGLGEFDLKREGYGPYHQKYEPYIQELIATQSSGTALFPRAQRRRADMARELTAWRIGAQKSSIFTALAGVPLLREGIVRLSRPGRFAVAQAVHWDVFAAR